MYTITGIIINDITYIATKTEYDMVCEYCDLAHICESDNSLADGIASLCIHLPNKHCFKCK